MVIGALHTLAWMFTPADATGGWAKKFAFACLLLVGWAPVWAVMLWVNRNNNNS